MQPARHAQPRHLPFAGQVGCRVVAALWTDQTRQALQRIAALGAEKLQIRCGWVGERDRRRQNLVGHRQLVLTGDRRNEAKSQRV